MAMGAKPTGARGRTPAPTDHTGGSRDLSRKLAAELLGTLWLVLGGCGSAVLAANIMPDSHFGIEPEGTAGVLTRGR
jgi:hypothetical protein